MEMLHSVRPDGSSHTAQHRVLRKRGRAEPSGTYVGDAEEGEQEGHQDDEEGEELPVPVQQLELVCEPGDHRLHPAHLQQHRAAARGHRDGPELRGARRAHPEGGHGGPPARCPGPESPKDKTALTRASRDPATGERGQGADAVPGDALRRAAVPGREKCHVASATCCTPAQGSRASRQTPLPPARLRLLAGSTGLAAGRVLTSEALRTPSVVVTGVTLGALFASLC